MTIPCRTIDTAGPNLFGDGIDSDPWVAFHGTSSSLESNIDSEGLDSSHARFSRTELAAVVAIFDRLDWAGEHLGGFPVLKPWSLGFDRSNGERPPLYLAESSHRAALYATQEFAGGEAARALRYAFHDLRRYSEGFIGEGTADERYWVRSQLEALSSTECAARQFSEHHAYGVVYAFRLQPSDLPQLTYSTSMGIIASSGLTPDRCLAKLLVPRDWEHLPMTDRRRLERQSEEGLITSIRQRDAAQRVD